jgi:hypothetical protein
MHVERGADVAPGTTTAIGCFRKIFLSVRRSWGRARSVASKTFWLSAVVQGLAWFVIPGAVVSHVVRLAPDGATSDRTKLSACAKR